MSRQSALGVVIRRRRLELGWTQEELAKRISAEGEYVRQSEISRLESGRIALPRRERLERIAVILDLPLGELLARSGWNGARESFDQAAPNTAVTPRTVVIEPNMTAVEAGGDLIIHGGTADADSRDFSVEAGNRDAVRELRRALLRMRAESERLSHNRQQAVAIGQQLEKQLEKHYERDAGATWAGDYPEATGS